MKFHSISLTDESLEKLVKLTGLVKADANKAVSLTPVDSFGALIDAIKVVRMVTTDDNISFQTTTAAITAQDLYTVLPEAVVQPDGVDVKVLSTQLIKLVPILVKELQDLRARVKALETRDKSDAP